MLCAALVVLGAGALAVAGQTSTIVKGKVLEKGVASLDSGPGSPHPVQTISVLIENDDRVFRIDRGTVAKYAVSDADALLVNVGSNVELLITSYSRLARVTSIGGTSVL